LQATQRELYLAPAKVNCRLMGFASKHKHSEQIQAAMACQWPAKNTNAYS
jgi:hypothetical protein